MVKILESSKSLKEFGFSVCVFNWIVKKSKDNLD